MSNLESDLSRVIITIGSISAIFSGILAFLALKSEWFRKFRYLKFLSPLINILIITNWLIAVIYCFTPTDEKMKKANEFVLKNMKIHLNERPFLGFSLEIQKSDFLFFAVIFNMIFLFFVLFSCILFSVNRIISKISSDLSNRNHFSSIYRLLCVQCISPTIFIIIPFTFNIITGVLGIDLGEV
ncbi:Protein CBG17879 [Caenorhabditis briggsae]|uniref:Protein CBG17879 n=1 Tax=Caenorhabditis briggsae TaxID=6238 RepID=A8XS03_CAEBR|nr:Protein CBG17879 [Caenorhabditis briggsae]CAP35422.2 Protein CBG17879 [Caenorhabditis briggsae]